MPRRLFDHGGAVLIRGVRRPLAGPVTMDQILVDCGPAGSAGVEVGDEVVLLGPQGDEEVTADEWAGLLGTISYEVLCGIGPRVPCPAVTDRRPAPARPLAVAAGDAGDELAELARQAAGCTRCPLAAGRTQVVFGAGDPDADLMFVGEAPGRDEDLQGEPFVGRSGKLLDRLLLEELGVDRSRGLHRQRGQVPAARQPRSRRPTRSPPAGPTCTPSWS